MISIYSSTECRVFHNYTYWFVKYSHFIQMMCYYLNVHFQSQRVKKPRTSPAAQNLRSTHISHKASTVFRSSCMFRTLRNVCVCTYVSLTFTVHRFSHSHASRLDIKNKWNFVSKQAEYPHGVTEMFVD